MKLKGKRIFIVEDDLGNRAIAQMLLEQAGATTAFERWGVETIQKLSCFDPVDVILLDLKYPRGVTGYDLFTKIRENEEFANVPIIAISANDPSDAIPRVKELGFDGFIAKPVDFFNFASQIAEILEGNSIWQSSR